MKKLLQRRFRRGRQARGPLFPNLPESIAYSAFLASGVEGVGELSFAQFVAIMGGKETQGVAAPSPDFSS